MNNYKKSKNGFTLIEMMVTIAIVGIFASIALPSFSSLIKSNRISTGTNELVSNLLLAKSEALKRSQTVSLCPSSDQTSCNGLDEYATGWIVFLDCDGNNATDDTVDDCVEEIIKVQDGIDSVFMTNPTVTKRVGFNYTGRPTGVSTFSIGSTSDSATVKTVTVNLVGRVKSQ